MHDDKIAVELYEEELLEVVGHHYEASALYRREGLDDAALEHWERAGELSALIPEDDSDPLTPDDVEKAQEAIARGMAEARGFPWPAGRAAMRALLRGPKRQG